MFRITFLLLILAQFSFGQAQKAPKQPPTVSPTVMTATDPALVAKVDSLHLALKETRLEFQSVKEINQDLRTLVWQLTLSIISIFGIAAGILGYLINKRAKEEKDYIASEAANRLAPQFEPRFAEITRVQTQHSNSILANYQDLLNYKADNAPKIGRIEIVKTLEDRVLRLEFSDASRDFKANISLIELHILNKEYSKAYDIIIPALQDLKENDPKGLFKFLAREYASKLVEIFTYAKSIRKSTLDEFTTKHRSLFDNEDLKKLETLLNGIPLKKEEEHGVFSALLDTPEDGGI